MTLHSDKKSEMEKFCQRCQSLGLAVTVQRRAVFQVLMECREHPTADLIYEVITKEFPNISRTSVYRILDTFVHHGMIRRVNHPDAATRYDVWLSPHHHAICVSCGEIADIPILPEDEQALERVCRSMEGFTICDFTVTFQGICRNCRQKVKS
ncbi:MAG: transcriptional repressor [Planctomycetaceae bacterium]|nr:transcriptional repressor [Planctomycetaceae bacterium]